MCSIITTHLERERGATAGGIHLHVILAGVQGGGGGRDDGEGGGGVSLLSIFSSSYISLSVFIFVPLL